MCVRCEGRTLEEVRQHYLELIEVHGWAVCGVEGGTEPPFAYTVGLTRFHGHPELLVSGLELTDATGLLNEVGETVREGVRLQAGGVMTWDDHDHRLVLLRVRDPDRLVYAQEIYRTAAGPVPALQVVWSDHDGRLPWDAGWSGGRRRQVLYGGRPPGLPD